MDEVIYKWIADYCNHSITKEDFEQLRAWIEEKPENHLVFERILQIHKEAREVGFIQSFNSEKSWEKLSRRLQRHVWLRRIRVAVAASILVGGLVGGWLLFSTQKVDENLSYEMTVVPGKASVILHMADGKSISLNDTVSFGMTEKDGTLIQKDLVNNMLVYQADTQAMQSVMHSIEVPVGGEFDLVLADGTRVWLNSMSELRFPTHFTGNMREVFVIGEAYFSVQKIPGHPFIVHTDQAQVRVLGTEFNVSAYPGDKMVTTLSRGKVEIVDGALKVCLEPGEQAICADGASSINVCKVDASLFSAWVKGVFEFENMSLREITKQLARWYDVTFLFEDESCAERRFTGGIKRYIPLNYSLDIIEKTTNVRFKMKEKEILVKSK